MRRWDRLLDTYMDEYRARRICQATVAATESRLHLCMPPAPPPRPMQPFAVAATPKIHFPLPQALTETGPSAARAAGLTLIPGKDHGVAPTTRPPLRQHDARSLTLRRTGRAKNRNKKSATWSQSRNRTLSTTPRPPPISAPPRNSPDTLRRASREKTGRQKSAHATHATNPKIGRSCAPLHLQRVALLHRPVVNFSPPVDFAHAKNQQTKKCNMNLGAMAGQRGRLGCHNVSREPAA